MRTLTCDRCLTPFKERQPGSVHLATYIVTKPEHIDEDDLHNSWGNRPSAGDYFEVDFCFTCSEGFKVWFSEEGEKLL